MDGADRLSGWVFVEWTDDLRSACSGRWGRGLDGACVGVRDKQYEEGEGGHKVDFCEDHDCDDDVLAFAKITIATMMDFNVGSEDDTTRPYAVLFAIYSFEVSKPRIFY